MNWRRRLWIVASALWIALVTWVEYDGVVRPYQEAARQQKCFETLKANPALGNPRSCLVGGIKFDDLIPIDREVAKFAALAFVPILATLVLGLAVAWIVAGFLVARP